LVGEEGGVCDARKGWRFARRRQAPRHGLDRQGRRDRCDTGCDRHSLVQCRTPRRAEHVPRVSIARFRASIQFSSAGVADAEHGPSVRLRPWSAPSGDLSPLRPGHYLLRCGMCAGGAAGVNSRGRGALSARSPGSLCLPAQRQRRYRARRRKATHRGSPAPPPGASLAPESRASAPPAESAGAPALEGVRCRFCGRVCSPFVRVGFLRQRRDGPSIQRPPPPRVRAQSP
jgi:hypothetical protein